MERARERESERKEKENNKKKRRNNNNKSRKLRVLTHLRFDGCRKQDLFQKPDGGIVSYPEKSRLVFKNKIKCTQHLLSESFSFKQEENNNFKRRESLQGFSFQSLKSCSVILKILDHQEIIITIIIRVLERDRERESRGENNPNNNKRFFFLAHIRTKRCAGNILVEKKKSFIYIYLKKSCYSCRPVCQKGCQGAHNTCD